MNIALWILQGLLGAMFIMAGSMKATQDKSKLAEKMPWVNDLNPKIVGVPQLLGGIGLIVPWATGIMPILTPIAAACLSFVMLLAIIYHLRKGEMKEAIPPFVLMCLTAFVAYGRF